MTNHSLSFADPTTLGLARALVHRAVQFPTLAARANLDPVADDSHSNLGWDNDRQAFVSQPLRGRSGACAVIVSLSPLSLIIEDGDGGLDQFSLHGSSTHDTHAWFEGALSRSGLTSASTVVLPYELPTDVAAVDRFNTDGLTEQLNALAGWYSLANASLTKFVGELGDLEPGPSPIRCWPHHFDIATYVGLEEGDFETARGVGVGMSPGDDAYGQPYFYINPWPHLDPTSLPDLPPPGHWHTSGFVGAIATGKEVLTLPDINAGLSQFISGAFSVGRVKLGF